MKKQNLFRIIVGVLGAIVIGAVGNGVWKYLLEPAVFKGRDFILDIAVLGIEKYKDYIYKEIAKGFHEAPSLELHSAILISFIIVYIMLALFFLDKSREIKQRHQKLLSNIKADLEGKARESKSLEELYDEASSIKPKRLLIASIIALFIIVFISANLLLNVVRSEYINSATTHFFQTHTIVKPYINVEQEKQFLSKFAQISKRQDYIDLLSNLDKIADKHNLMKPKFDAW